MDDTADILGPELLRRTTQVREELEAAITRLEAAVRSLEPAERRSRLMMIAALQRSIEMIEQALEHLDIADQVAAGEAGGDEP